MTLSLRTTRLLFSGAHVYTVTEHDVEKSIQHRLESLSAMIAQVRALIHLE